jgi:hypothetical protein
VCVCVRARACTKILRPTPLNYTPRPPTHAALIYRSALAAALAASGGALKLVVTAQKWDDEALLDLIEHFADSQIPLGERRRLVAGYLIHPAFCQPWHTRLAEEKERKAAAEAGAASAPAGTEVSSSGRFSVRRHAVTNVAQAIVLNNEQPPRASGHETLVPLDHLLRKLALLGRNDRETPIGMIYAQLNRLRGLQRDSDTLNSTTDEEIEADAELTFRMHGLLDQLSALGFSPPAQGRVPVHFEALAELIATVEVEHRELVDGGRAAACAGRPIEYMALQELYPIGSVVVTDGLGGLGGTPVALRVHEAFYEPQRSIFGGRKYSFRLVLECVVGLAGEFICVRFQQTYEEWVGTREQSKLPVRPLSADGIAPAELTRRADLIRSLGGGHSYRAYRAGCFFPHTTRGPSTGGAASADRRAAPGDPVV